MKHTTPFRSRRAVRLTGMVLLVAMLAGVLCLSASAANTNMEKVTSVFPRLPEAWVGDVMPMPDGNGLRLYYLYDLNNNTWPMHPFYSFTTENFYEFYGTRYGVSGSTNRADQDHLGLGTGSVILGRDGLYHTFYTGVNTLLTGKTTAIMHATSTDQVTWTKHPEDTIYPPEGYNKEDYRDSEVMWVEEEGKYWMTVSGRCVTNGNENGVVLLYTSDDLSHWTFEGNLFTPNHYYMLECSDIVKIGNLYYLFYSWNCITYYAVSESIRGPYRDPADNILSSDSFTFYAAKVGTVGDKNYLCAWLGRKAGSKDSAVYDWGGNMVIFELNQKADGTLGLDAPSTYADYFRKPYAFLPVSNSGDVKQDGNSLTLKKTTGGANAYVSMGELPKTMMLTCKVRFSSAMAKGGFCFGTNGVTDDSLYVMLNASNSRVQYDGKGLGDKTATAERVGSMVTFRFEPNTDYTLKLVVEDEIIALYINGEKTAINRIYSAVGMDWGFFASERSVTFSDVEIRVTDSVRTEPGTPSGNKPVTPSKPGDSDGATDVRPGGDTTGTSATETKPETKPDTPSETGDTGAETGTDTAPSGGCASALGAASLLPAAVAAAVIPLCRRRRRRRGSGRRSA